MKPTTTETTERLVEQWSQRLLTAVDIGLAATLFVAPLFMAGRHALGRLVFVGCVCWVAVAWTLRQCLRKRAVWTVSGAEWLLGLGLLVVLLQLTPLPAAILQRLSPAVYQLLPLWSGSQEPASLGAWHQISLAPSETQGGLIMYLAYAMLFLAVVQRVRSLEDIERLLRWIACAAIGMAALGLLQFLGGNGKFLWFYQHPSRTTFSVVKGMFANQNHFAHFLALGVGPLLWWWQASRRGRAGGQETDRVSGRSTAWATRWRQAAFASRAWTQHPAWTRLAADAREHALPLSIGLVSLAGLLTFSRGGVIAIGVSVTVSLASFFWLGLLNRRAWIGVSAVAVVIVAALTIYGYEPLARRLGTLRDARNTEELLNGRQALWEADKRAIRQFPLLGTGVGTHREVYPIYLQKHFGVNFTHAESGYLHLLLETGALGLGCMLIAIATILNAAYRMFRSVGTERVDVSRCTIGVAILAGLLASVVHSLGDFVWYIPACMSVTVVLVACGARFLQLHAQRDRSIPLQRPVAVALAGATLLLTGYMLHDRIPPARAALAWEQYQRAARGKLHSLPSDASDAEKLAAQQHYLEETVRRDPHDARAHLRLTAVYLETFESIQQSAENPMNLSQIRDAALASEFPTRQAQDAWLDVAVAENRRYIDAALVHCRQALKLCPVQGEGYIHLAELLFLEGRPAIPTEALVSQALSVRPHKGIVQVAAGKEAALAGDYQQALVYWRLAFHQEPDTQTAIIQILAPQVPADFFLSSMQPDVTGLGKLFHFYRTRQFRDEAVLAGQYYVQVLPAQARAVETSQSAASYWREAATVHEYLGDLSSAIECQQQAVEALPEDFSNRKLYATLLARDHRYDEATEALQWCLRRQPDDTAVVDLLAQVNRERWSAQRPTTSLLNR